MHAFTLLNSQQTQLDDLMKKLRKTVSFIHTDIKHSTWVC